MSFCLGWQNAFDAVGMHGRRWFSDMIPMRVLGSGLLMMLLWVLLIIGIIFLVVRLSRSNSDSRYVHQARQDNAVNILRERFARGEISQEEYEERLKILKEEK
ncbi:MAG: SHOCT domain-containing protein [Caldicoprobacterales bacterium]|nr:hypothetical protein [Clostridiales bacterium]